MAAGTSSPSPSPVPAETAGGDLGPLVRAGIVLGVGFAAFFDGIVLHQILQWHHMICQERTCTPMSVADLQRKDRADGYFHLGAYVVTLLGTFLLFRAGGRPGVRWSGRALLGGILTGVGLFNLIEGIVDHEILGIHHVRFGPHRDIYDVAFLVVAAAIWALGGLLVRAAARGRPVA